MSATQAEVCPKLVVAVEIASARWVVASFAGGARGPRRKSLSEATPQARFDALLAEIEEARRRLEVAARAPVLVAYEAGHEGFWLVRALRARGLQAEVIDPVSVPVDRRARRAKTDRLDVQAQVMALWRHAQGELGALRMVRVPSETAEDTREWQRERDRLMAERRGCQDRIVKKLRRHGIWILPDAWRQALREGRLRTYAGTALGPMLQAALTIELDRLEAAEAKLKGLEAQLEQLDGATATRIERLQQLCGIGAAGARALAMRLYWRRFENRRQVGACVGLVGVPYDSGTMRQDQGISKAGDPRLRALLIELSWLWLRHQPGSDLARWFGARTQGQGKRHKRVMITAVARRLAIVLWRYLRDGLVPAGARLKAVTA